MPDLAAPTSATLLIEGWRGVNHSYALVNQHQILELLKLNELHLFHRDLPFRFGHWNRRDNDAGFSPLDRARIDALVEPGDAPVDCVYRICAPIPGGAEHDRRRTLTFMITELGLSAGCFAAGADRAGFFTRDANRIITSSAWSRARIVEYGFDPAKVDVVSCGVCSETFSRVSAAERAASRAALGYSADATVFLNIGVPLWNKGIDALLLAFARLRERGRPVRLILKDQRDVYGMSVERMIQEVGQRCPSLLSADTLAAISVIPGNLDRGRLRLLYGLADAYVSPYRAEGFNLPVLEAIACGTPVVVTRGGATDDFCDDDVACRIPGEFGRLNDVATGLAGAYIEPDADGLVEALDGFVVGPGLDRARFDAGCARVADAFNWPRVTRKLAELVLGHPVTAAPVLPRVRQRDVLDLLAMIRPRAMAQTTKVRVGNAYDGGYVLPVQALRSDAVVSIGVGSDVSFDLGLAERGARVLLFDNTVEAAPVKHANFTFHHFGWGGRSGGNLLDFDDIHAMLTRLMPQHALLKFDIEGAEYEALGTTDPDKLAEYEVIVCDLHDLGRLAEPARFARVREALARLTRHHMPVHLHVSNYRGVALVEGVPVPDVIELSLLRRDLDRFPGWAADPIPGALDAPNHPLVPDICLNAF